MVATFKGSNRRRSLPPAEKELQTPLEDLMFSPYKRRKMQKQKDQDEAALARLKEASKYYDMIDNVKLETAVAVEDDPEDTTSPTTTPSTTPTKDKEAQRSTVGSDDTD
ncbi:Aste57867_13261 [Aphanomyces stellatus]|uniref:Aste57867_13261 protein n=1 Tax=Aphanomyces stellatus TaxID=120398 RepID=A0A485KXQ0_9STRA|nr:hypothetical protein As57867_013212 [Aphanomyces stellatus]VFT90101.1 Aste57867_13261 [Aphanomyces stellatus]